MLECLVGLLLALIPVIILIWFIVTYNGFIKLRNQAENAWAQIDVQTKKRYDLVPNLVETVKAYASHEKEVLTGITQARSAISKAGSVEDRVAAENQLTGALKTLFAVSENYPDLKANKNFLMLQEELAGIENKIAYARQFYNDSVMRWNQKIETMPANLVAAIFSFKQKTYFEVEEVERKSVKVNF
ncbi:MAG TPA: LemA family protein [Euryarchaeota archaeon]|nr:LemA family protein [Euryarchaeota archaeon]